jgi:hypothetical protein
MAVAYHRRTSGQATLGLIAARAAGLWLSRSFMQQTARPGGANGLVCVASSMDAPKEQLNFRGLRGFGKGPINEAAQTRPFASGV